MVGLLNSLGKASRAGTVACPYRTAVGEATRTKRECVSLSYALEGHVRLRPQGTLRQDGITRLA